MQPLLHAAGAIPSPRSRQIPSLLPALFTMSMTQSPTPSTSAPTEPLPNSNATASPPPRRKYTFKDMRLQVGDRLQMQGPAQFGGQRTFVRVMGYLEGSSLMVTPPVIQGQRIALLEGEQLILRTFSGQSAFAFRCTVLRTCKLPFEYIHLSFPDKIQGSVIRKSPRVRTALDVAINGRPTDGSMRIDNLSATGALLVAPEAVAGRGDTIRIDFEVTLHDVQVPLQLEARVLNVTHSAAQENGEPACVLMGVEFSNLSPQNRMILKSVIYQHLIESPNSVI